MGLFESVFGSESGARMPEEDSEERFPRDTYSPAWEIAITQAELDAMHELADRLLESEGLLGESPELEKIVEETFEEALPGEGGGENRAEEAAHDLKQVADSWESQLLNDPGAVWWTLATKRAFMHAIASAESRDDIGEDDFEFPENFEVVREIKERGDRAEDAGTELAGGPKLAITHKDYLPLESAPEDSK